MAPPYTQLDQNQILQRSFDEASDALKVKLDTPAVLEVNLDNANDDVLIYGFDGSSNQKVKTDTSGQLVVSPVTLDVVDFFDTPVLDTSLTNIPASAGSPLQVVASLAAAVKKIKINDTTGAFIGIYTGAAASEVLQAIVGPGEDGTIEVAMAPGERVSIRNMANSAINVGELCIQFLG